jgi:Tol biopolymer transport system component
MKAHKAREIYRKLLVSLHKCNNLMHSSLALKNFIPFIKMEQQPMESVSRLKTLIGHSLRVNSMVFSRDGERFASASWKILIHNPHSGEEMQMLMSGSARAYTYSVSFSPDNSLLVSASSDKYVRIWDTKNGKELRSIVAHKQAVNHAEFSPDGKRVVSVSSDKTVKLWDAIEGKKVGALSGHTDGVNWASFSPDGKMLATACQDKLIRLYNPATQSKIQQLSGHAHNVTVAKFSPDSKKIVSASWDKTIKIWDVEKGSCIVTLDGHKNGVEFLEWMPNGNAVVSASYSRVANEGTVKLWDATTGKEMDTVVGEFYGIAFSPTANLLAVARKNRAIELWNTPIIVSDKEGNLIAGVVKDRRKSQQRGELDVKSERRKQALA